MKNHSMDAVGAFRLSTRTLVAVALVVSGAYSQQVHTIWAPIDGWNMYSGSTTYSIPLANLGLSLSSHKIVGLSASIISDPDANGKVEVHGIDLWGYYSFSPYRGRGGEIKVVGGTTPSIILTTGPVESPHRVPATKYRAGTAAGGRSSGYAEYKLGAPYRRGYLKVEYIGAKSAYKVKIAVGSNVISVSNWNMNTGIFHADAIEGTLPVTYELYGTAYPFPFLSPLSANRIAGLSTTIRSDLFSGSNYVYSNFHRVAMGGGHKPQRDWKGGGATIIDEVRGQVSLLQRDQNTLGSYFRFGTYSFTGTSLRAQSLFQFVKGTCEQGPDNYQINAIPRNGNPPGDCAGAAQPFTIRGSGLIIASGVTPDDFVFTYRSVTGATASETANRTISVKVENMNSGTDWDALSGLMFRADLNANSRHVSMVAKLNPNQRFSMRSRTSTGSGGAIIQTSANFPSNTFWLRVRKQGNNFYTYYNLSTSNTMPLNNWVQLGTTQTISGFPQNYFVGLATANYSGDALSSISFRGLTLTNP